MYGTAVLSTPPTNNAPDYLVKYGFFKLTSSSVMFYLFIAIYHAWMAIYIIVILIDCIGFLMRLPTFG